MVPRTYPLHGFISAFHVQVHSTHRIFQFHLQGNDQNVLTVSQDFFSNKSDDIKYLLHNKGNKHTPISHPWSLTCKNANAINELGVTCTHPYKYKARKSHP